MPSTGSRALDTAGCWLSWEAAHNKTASRAVVSDIATELRTAYPGMTVRTSQDGLSIPQEDLDGFHISLILLENGIFYLNLGLAEFEVDDRQLATDILLLGCSRECRLRTTYTGCRVRGWFLDVRFNGRWHCIHSGGVGYFSAWLTVKKEQKMNARQLPGLANPSRNRLVEQFEVYCTEPGRYRVSD